MIGSARGQDLGHPLSHSFRLAGAFEQGVHLLDGDIGPTGQNEQEVVVGMNAHPLHGRRARTVERLVRVEPLRETVVAAAGQAFDKRGGRVACGAEDLGECRGLVGHRVSRHPQPVGGRVEAAEKSGQRRLGLWSLCERPLEAHRLGGEGVEGRRPGRCPVAAESVRPEPIQGDDDDRVGAGDNSPFLGLLTPTGHQHQDRQTADRSGGREALQ